MEDIKEAIKEIDEVIEESSVRANFSYKAILLDHPIAAPPFSYSDDF